VDRSPDVGQELPPLLQVGGAEARGGDLGHGAGVQEDPNAPTDRRTALLAEKYILFDGPYATWPTLACDLFWTEFAITMALGC
jgi:hypothetical protein